MDPADIKGGSVRPFRLDNEDLAVAAFNSHHDARRRRHCVSHASRPGSNEPYSMESACAGRALKCSGESASGFTGDDTCCIKTVRVCK